jgi:membrane protein YqaA with SNARE-associated domain
VSLAKDGAVVGMFGAVVGMLLGTAVVGSLLGAAVGVLLGAALHGVHSQNSA